ncbi:MAG TPA: methylated-DNA--[protein]-cysteine S-methyltransferase [Aestuariivirga sp.]|nr:methylated-DNA--[protein]-cysteine S-methyltransferase [Aestuariivirga sp.]
MTAIPQPDAEKIRFAFGSFCLGVVLVAVGGKGIVALLMGDSEDALRRELKANFPHVQLSAGDAGLAKTVAEVAAFLDAPQNGLDLPLDIRGSAQEQAVWQALRQIPAGQTTTYGEIAKTLPFPVTAQDVGAACAANRLAVAIPCHRVVKADGSISGYRWGVARKRKLINREAVA